MLQRPSTQNVIGILILCICPQLFASSYFPTSYEEARQNFLSSAQAVIEKIPSSEIGSHQITSSTDSDLFVNTLIATPIQPCKKTLILVSGTHGIEGFVGSAVQSYFINEIYLKIENPQTCLLLIHSLNPYGFRYLRRVTEANVDLNRNFSKDASIYLEKNLEYKKITPFLNPSKKAEIYFYSKINFFAMSIWQILNHGMNNLKQAILRGQYFEPKGVFYGGNKPEHQVLLINELISDRRIAAPETVFVDIHTGYGKKGKLHILGSPTPGQDIQLLEKTYGSSVEYGNTENSYKISGGLNSYIGNIYGSQTKFAGAVWEFGTMDSQSYYGSIESLRRTVLENQRFFYGATEKDNSQIQKQFLEMFSPSDLGWQKNVLYESNLLLKKILQ